MPPTFIAGFDGSDGSRAAVHFASRLARAVAADVVAVTGYVVPSHVAGKGASDGAGAALAEDSRIEAERTLAELQEDGVAQCIARPGGAAQALVEAADDLGAELIVVGTHEAKGVQRLKLGSTAERVVHGAPCPVAIVPYSVGASAPKAIAVAYDGRAPAQTALAYAAGLARLFSARLALIAVAEPFGDGHWEGHGADSRIASPIVDAADAAAEALRPELEVEVRTEVGAPREAIIAACTDDIDLLVTGSRAYGPLHATLVGSVSHHLAAHSYCPVIVVPRQLNQVDAIMAGTSVMPGRTG
jgi:nucleotide-binding universal stress UspA family protein